MSTGPAELLLVRHGESAGNVAREIAHQRRAEVIDIEWRDADAPLSARGREQAAALGDWLAALPEERRPVAVWSSPYVRARDTAELSLAGSGIALPMRLDERLRDRELGVLDRLTGFGIRARLPEEAARRRHLGKLYYRPPGGESWADIALRLRSFLRDLSGEPLDGPVLITTHDAVIILFRYVLEQLDERRLLELAAGESVGNASVTRLVRDAPRGPWRAVEFGAVDHLTDQGVAATSHATETDARPH